MSSLKRLISEIHHRSLWQVVLIYVGAGWIVFEIVQTVTEGLGLPHWFPAFAALLLLIGLPSPNHQPSSRWRCVCPISSDYRPRSITRTT